MPPINERNRIARHIVGKENDSMRPVCEKKQVNPNTVCDFFIRGHFLFQKYKNSNDSGSECSQRYPGKRVHKMGRI